MQRLGGRQTSRFGRDFGTHPATSRANHKSAEDELTAYMAAPKLGANLPFTQRIVKHANVLESLAKEAETKVFSILSLSLSLFPPVPH